MYTKDNKYYPKVFLEECKYVLKEKKIHNYITDEVEISSDEEDLLEKIQMERNSDYGENSDKEIMEKIQMEKVLMKKIKYKIFSGFLGCSSFIFRA